MNLLSPRLALACLLVLPVLGMAPPDPAKQFERAVRSNNTDRIVQAAKLLQAQPSAKGVKALVKFGLAIEDIDVYLEVRAALSEAKSDKPRQELLKALKRSKRFEQRVLCADALARAGDPEAIEALGEALADSALPVRITAIRGLQLMEKRECVPLLFERLGQLDMQAVNTEVEELYSALLDLTGQGFETLEDWRKFWETSGADFDPGNRGEAVAGETRQRESAGKLFDSEIISKKFVLVLDISNSMRVIDLEEGKTSTNSEGQATPYRDPGSNWPPDKDSRFERAKKEFKAFIQALDARVEFTIVVFGTEADTRALWPQLQRATPANKKQATDFVTGVRWSYATRTDKALEQAFAIPNADTLYLFSDGIPERRAGDKTERIDKAEVAKLARTLNRTRKLRINMFGFATIPEQTKTFLREIAEESGGEYKDIR